MSTARERRDTVVVGGGQAGLATSYLLSRDGRDHVVLERRAQVGDRWRGRWDSFTLTPNWQLQLPGFAYGGDDPDGFLTRDEVVAHLEAYAGRFDPPSRCGVTVTGVEPRGDDRPGYRVQTSDRTYDAANVVIAAGTFQHARVPASSGRLSTEITQLHSSSYENPAALPEGGVLVVGGGQSGCQIALELHEHGITLLGHLDDVRGRQVRLADDLYDNLAMHWLHTRKSGLFLGVGNDAAHVVAHIGERSTAAGG